MFRYRAAAIALKAIGATGATRRLYRTLGNRLRGYVEDDVDGYLEKSYWLISRSMEHGRVGRAAEIGTGWMHFFGVAMALAGASSVDTYDVWDNRQLKRLKMTFARLGDRMGELGIPAAAQTQAHEKIVAIEAATRWDDLYNALGLSYSLECIRPAAYDLVFSVDVLEHVDATTLPSLIRSMYDSLAPGGISLHHVGLDDHLSHYDRSASPKQFFAFPEWKWRLLYQNRIQYFNRNGFSALRSMFHEAGFEEIECTPSLNDKAIDGIVVAPQFLSLSKEDLLATTGRFVHRKPHPRDA